MNPELLKGHLDAIVLATLEEGAAHGYAIIEEIKRRSAGTFDLPEGTIYPALHRLEQAKFLSSVWVTLANGRRRRMYSLTKRGAAALRESKSEWKHFSETVATLLGGTHTWPA